MVKVIVVEDIQRRKLGIEQENNYIDLYFQVDFLIFFKVFGVDIVYEECINVQKINVFLDYGKKKVLFQ